MDVSVVAGDLRFALDLLHLREREPVLLSFPPGLAEVSVLRHGWETVFFETDRPDHGPAPCTVVGSDLLDALDQPMYIHLGVTARGLLVGDRQLPPAHSPIPPPPRRSTLVGTAPINLPGSSSPAQRAVLCEVPGGGRVHVHSLLAHRFVVRQIPSAQLFRCEPGAWALVGVQAHESHPLAVTGYVTVW